MTDFSSGAAAKRVLAACIALWLVVAGVSIFLHGPMPLYSTRTLSVGWEMWHSGSWLVPLQNGMQYSHKAPLLYWLYHAGWAVAGVNDTWPRVLALAFGALALVLTSRLARALYPQRPDAAVLAPWIVAGSTFFLLFALQLMFDVLLGLFVLAAFLALLRGDIYRGVPSWIGFALALGLGLLVKGPVMLLHVVFPVLLAPLWSEQARAAPARWYLRAGLAVLGGVALFACWVVPVVLHGDPAYREALL
ncbi:MAG TPA: glycosyltransferase family 39 protein, partial [Xanthomonadales bacterium]|nr:glycosyltransferase family 39 protein [Xanthomonadales bacterium]